MMPSEFNDSADIDQEIRINELREAAGEAAGAEMTYWESADTPPDIAEQFWGNVLAYESADETTHFKQLMRQGIEMPRPEDLNDDALATKLWEVIHALAKFSVFMSTTDHWSDRELYERLWHDTLHEETIDFPPGSGWNCHIDFLSGGSKEDTELYLKYHADEEWRAKWQKDFPDYVMPDHVDPPYDRDRKLPKLTE